MKNPLRLFLAGLLLLAPAALSAAAFEGKVTFKMMSGRGESHELTYNLKGSKMRVEFPGQTAMGGGIMDLAKKEMIMLMPQQKMYMVMPIPDAATEGPADDVKLEKTSETEKILGHTATKYLSTSEGTTTELWLAEGLGGYMTFNANAMGGRKRGSADQAWARALAGKELFPLRVVGRDKRGKESFRMEVTDISKESLPDSLFTPPSDYKQFSMGGMLKGLMPGSK